MVGTLSCRRAGNNTVDHQNRNSAISTGIVCRNDTVLSPRGRGRCVTPTSTTDLPVIRGARNSSALIRKPLVVIGRSCEYVATKQLHRAITIAHARAQQQPDQHVVDRE